MNPSSVEDMDQGPQHRRNQRISTFHLLNFAFADKEIQRKIAIRSLLLLQQNKTKQLKEQKKNDHISVHLSLVWGLK